VAPARSRNAIRIVPPATVTSDGPRLSTVALSPRRSSSASSWARVGQITGGAGAGGATPSRASSNPASTDCIEVADCSPHGGQPERETPALKINHVERNDLGKTGTS